MCVALERTYRKSVLETTKERVGKNETRIGLETTKLRDEMAKAPRGEVPSSFVVACGFGFAISQLRYVFQWPPIWTMESSERRPFDVSREPPKKALHRRSPETSLHHPLVSFAGCRRSLRRRGSAGSPGSKVPLACEQCTGLGRWTMERILS